MMEKMTENDRQSDMNVATASTLSLCQPAVIFLIFENGVRSIIHQQRTENIKKLSHPINCVTSWVLSKEPQTWNGGTVLTRSKRKGCQYVTSIHGTIRMNLSWTVQNQLTTSRFFILFFIFFLWVRRFSPFSIIN